MDFSRRSPTSALHIVTENERVLGHGGAANGSARFGGTLGGVALAFAICLK